MSAPVRYMPPPTFDALGVDVAALDQDGFLAVLEAWHLDAEASKKGSYVIFRDVHGVVRAWEDAALADAHRRALMNAPDGKPLVWLGRRRGISLGQVCGPDLLPAVCNFGVTRDWRHVLYGSTPDVLEDLTAKLRKIAPGAQIVDSVSPPFRTLTEAEIEADLDRIRASKPQFVWIGIGSPKQEIWMSHYAERIPGAICMGVGAAFDMHADRIPRAPALMRNLGLEWLSRAVREPRRLGLRYANVVPRFILAALREEFGFRQR